MIKKILRSPITTIVLFVLAAALIGYGGVNGAQAAPAIASSYWRGEVNLKDISTVITEQGEIRRGDDTILQDLVTRAGDKELKIGKSYPELLAVKNCNDDGSVSDGLIDEYVRVTVYKYWEDANGAFIPITTLDPSLIEIEWDESNGWKVDKAASTTERTVLYYHGTNDDGTIAPGESTPPFTKSVTISGDVLTSISKAAGKDDEDKDKFDYEGVTFRVKAVADAVQTHNGDDAMKSAWGRKN